MIVLEPAELKFFGTSSHSHPTAPNKHRTTRLSVTGLLSGLFYPALSYARTATLHQHDARRLRYLSGRALGRHHRSGIRGPHQGHGRQGHLAERHATRPGRFQAQQRGGRPIFHAVHPGPPHSLLGYRYPGILEGQLMLMY